MTILVIHLSKAAFDTILVKIWRKNLVLEGAVLNLNIFGIPAPIWLGLVSFESKKILVSEYHLTLEVKHVVFL